MEENGIIQGFLTHLRDTRRLSGDTVKSYGFILGKFTSFLKDQNQLLLSADADSIRAYLDFMKKKGNSPATVVQNLKTLRSLYKFLVGVGSVESNPAAAVGIPKLEERHPRFLNYGEVKKLLEAPPMDNWIGARDRAVLETLYGTAMKPSELVALNMEDVDFLGEVVHIRKKGGPERVVPVSSSALQVIQHYMFFRKKRTQGDANFDAEALFVNKYGKRLGRKWVEIIMKKYLRMAGTDISLSPKTLRHSFAVHMLNNGADLRTVQELLGIRSPAMMKVYSQLAGRQTSVTKHKSCRSSSETIK